MKRFLAVLLLLSLIFPLNASGKNIEEIENFETTIDIKLDGTAEVTEKFTINVLHNKVKLGIIRELLYFMTEPSSKKTKRLQYNVTSVKRNGESEHYWTDSNQYNFYIFTGAISETKENMIPLGLNTFEIKYTVSNLLIHYPDSDAIYFNITGNQWEFEIKKASATVNLPQNMKIIEYDAFTGRYKENKKDFTASLNGESSVSFHTLKPLRVGEGISVVVSFDKGIIFNEFYPDFNVESEASIQQKKDASIYYKDFIQKFTWFAFFISLYYALMWFIFGKDKPLPPIVPLFSLNKEICPAIASMLLKKEDDQAVITATLINLASKGYISINSDKNETALTRLDKKIIASELNNVEVVFMEKLFEKKTKLFFRKSFMEIVVTEDTKTFSDAVKDLFKEVKDKKSEFIMTNSFAINLAIFFYIIFAVNVFNPDNILPAVFITTLVLISLLISLFLKFIFNFKFRKISFNLEKTVQWIVLSLRIGSIFSCLSIASIGFISTLFRTSEIDMFNVSMLALLIIVMNITFSNLIDAPKEKGRKAIAEILGLKMYIESVDAQVYKKITPDIFEKNLAFAIIFGAEKKWISKFSSLHFNYEAAFFNGRVPLAKLSLSLNDFSKSVSYYSSTTINSRRSGGGFSGGFSGGGGGGGGGGGR